MLTSNGTGYSAASTAPNGDAAVTLIPAQTDGNAKQGAIINETSSVGGFFSVDGGKTWGRIPPGNSSVTLPAGPYANGVMFKRSPGGTDLTAVWCFLFTIADGIE